MISAGRLKNDKLALLICGSLCVFIIFQWPVLIFLSFLTWLIVLSLSGLSPEDRKPLKNILVLALVVRIMFLSLIVASLFFSTSRWNLLATLLRDFDREIKNALLIADYLSGYIPQVSELKDISFGQHGYLHFGAFFYGWLNFLLGKSPLNLLVTPFLSLFSVIVAYLLSKEVFGRRTAVFTAAMVSFYPSPIIWSCSNVRMSLGILGMLIMVYSLVLFGERNRLKHLLLMLISIYIFSFVKEKFFLPAAVIIIIGIFLNLCLRLRYKLLGATLFLLFALKNALIQRRAYLALKDVIVSQAGFVDPYSNYYKIYDEVVYQTTDLSSLFSLPGLIALSVKALPKGLFYFLFSPLPGGVSNISYFIAYPFVILWYFVFFFALLGFFKYNIAGGRKHWNIVFVTVFFIILFSLVFGNQGIAVRFRDLVLPFFFMFAGYLFLGDAKTEQ
jgi:hypothetical protein